MDPERPENEGAAQESQADETPTPQEAPPAEASAAAPVAVTATSGKADLGKRFIAVIIDGAIAAAVGLIPVVGGIIGIVYILTRDGFEYDFMKYRSIGKQLMKLRPVIVDGGQMSIMTSVRRNWTLVFGSLAQVLIFIPIIGWLLIPIVGIVGAILGIVEIVLVLTNDEGRPLGRPPGRHQGDREPSLSRSTSQA